MVCAHCPARPESTTCFRSFRSRRRPSPASKRIMARPVRYCVCFKDRPTIVTFSPNDQLLFTARTSLRASTWGLQFETDVVRRISAQFPDSQDRGNKQACFDQAISERCSSGRYGDREAKWGGNEIAHVPCECQQPPMKNHGSQIAYIQSLSMRLGRDAS